MRILSRDIEKYEGKKEIILEGWINGRRDHGKLVFLDLRDRSGLVQLVYNSGAYNEKEALNPETHPHLWRPGDIVRVEGLVKKRPSKMVNEDLLNGHLEVEIIERNSKMLAEVGPEAFPMPLDGSGYEINEEVRMKYRYLDLRRPRMQMNMRKRAGVTKLIRDFLTSNEFMEVETPILTKSTPEGARDYLVPARLHSGKFYALPQSPQQYKQLLMVAGMERYFQIARCFRDEDTRGDRQPEFTQLDLEMSFVEREDVMALNEKLLIEIVKKLYPEKKIQETPFPRLTYEEAMEKYKTERPDLRKDKNNPDVLAFCWIIDFPFFEKSDKGGWTFTHNPFSAPKEEFMDDLLAKKNIPDILTSQYDIVLNGWEIGGGSIRNHKPDALSVVFEIIGIDKDKIKENFGHMLEALNFGAPPHGGIAWGLDRLVMILQNEPNIREVIAFPKTGDGRDLMMDAPSDVSKEQLKELHLKIEK